MKTRKKKVVTSTQARNRAVNTQIKSIQEFARLRNKPLSAVMMRFIRLSLNLAFIEGQDYQLTRDEQLLKSGAQDAVIHAAIESTVKELARG